MSTRWLTAAGPELLAHPGHAGSGSVLPGVLLLLLAALALLVTSAVVRRAPRGTTRVDP